MCERYGKGYRKNGWEEGGVKEGRGNGGRKKRGGKEEGKKKRGKGSGRKGETDRHSIVVERGTVGSFRPRETYKKIEISGLIIEVKIKI